MELEEQSAGIAKSIACLIAPPHGRSEGAAIAAHGLDHKFVSCLVRSPKLRATD
jgi:hypothetical protein